MTQELSAENNAPQFTNEEIETLKKLLGFSKSVIDSLNTGAIVSMTSTLSTYGVILDNFNTPEFQNLLIELSKHGEEFTDLVKTLSQMSKDGTLDSLIELATFAVAIKKSMNTEMIVKMINMIPEIVKSTFTVEEIVEAVNESKEEAEKTGKVGIGTLFRTMRDPDMQYLINFMLIFAKKASGIIKDQD